MKAKDRKAAQAEADAQRAWDYAQGRIPKADLKPSEKKAKLGQAQGQDATSQDLNDKIGSIEAAHPENVPGKTKQKQLETAYAEAQAGAAGGAADEATATPEPNPPPNPE